MRNLQQKCGNAILRATLPERGTAKIQTPSDPKASAQEGQHPVQFYILSLINTPPCQPLYKGQKGKKHKKNLRSLHTFFFLLKPLLPPPSSSLSVDDLVSSGH